jgi:Secretion system C-terminal sorting domain
MIRRLLTIAAVLLAFGYTNSSFATINVKFQVHMGVQMQLGNFNPASDTVYVRGDFQTMAGDTANWYGGMFVLTQSTTNDSIYEITVPFADSAANVGIQYKYVIDWNGWENNNRSYTITSDLNQVIPLVYFNDRTSVGITVNITFQADMTDLLNEGFVPGTDSIEIMGDTSPLTWTPPGAVLAQDLINPDLFSVTLTFQGEPGSAIQWKFHCDPANSFTNGGWESADNHILTFPMGDTTLSAIAPVVHVATPTTADNTVYFRVDMNGAVERFHNTPITGLKSVWVGGAALPLQWPSNWTFPDTASGILVKMYDDGTHSDSIAGDKVFSNMLVFPTGTPASVDFKYGAVFDGVDTLNGGASYLDNEAGFSQNHFVSLHIGGGTVYRINMFGDQATAIQQVPDNNIPETYTLSQNYPNPFNPTTNIVYTVPKSGLVTLKVYNILGQEVTTLFQGFQNTGKYIANFDASKLSSGVYFYRLQAGNATLTKKMMLMK